MLTTDRERKICKKYSARDADGKVNCHSCPLNKGNPNIYDFRCKANSHYDRHKKEWVEDERLLPYADVEPYDYTIKSTSNGHPYGAKAIVKRCGNCEHCTFRFNKVWCNIKSEPYPQKVCEHWKMKGEG